jgi:hypothetical protein
MNDMNLGQLRITPKTKIGELLEAYPELESVLTGISPVFDKLKNPVLRRTVARVATIQQISVVGGIPVDDIIKRLRKETGQENDQNDSDAQEELTGEAPAWFNKTMISQHYDATPVINSGESPMSEVLKRAAGLGRGEILELKTPFIPAPVLEMLKNKKFRVYVVKDGETINSYISKED